MKVDIQIATRDRPAELAILLSSLLNQSYTDWNLVIADGSQNPIQNFKFINDLLARIKLEGHGVWLIRDFGKGVCEARNQLLKENPFNSELILRIDDDSWVKQDYIERLVYHIESGADGVSGVVPGLGYPEFYRKTPEIINKITYEQGNITLADDCGFSYEEAVKPAHHMRSSFMIKREVYETIGGYELGLGRTGWREETYFSIKMAYAGFKMIVDTGAVAYHQQAHQGGVRDANYSQKLQILEERFVTWARWLYKKFGNPYEKNYNPTRFLEWLKEDI